MLQPPRPPQLARSPPVFASRTASHLSAPVERGDQRRLICVIEIAPRRKAMCDTGHLDSGGLEALSEEEGGRFAFYGRICREDDLPYFQSGDAWKKFFDSEHIRHDTVLRRYDSLTH